MNTLWSHYVDDPLHKRGGYDDLYFELTTELNLEISWYLESITGEKGKAKLTFSGRAINPCPVKAPN